MVNNDNNGKHKFEEEVESLIARQRLRLSDKDTGDNDTSDSLEEETEEEEEEEVVVEEETEEVVSSEEMLMNQLGTSVEKLLAKHARGIIFGDDSDTTSPSLEPHTPESHQCFDKDSSDDDDF
jgi:hypothetical protein